MKKFFIAAILMSFALVKAEGTCTNDKNCNADEKCEVVCKEECNKVECKPTCVKKAEADVQTEEISVEAEGEEN